PRPRRRRPTAPSSRAPRTARSHCRASRPATPGSWPSRRARSSSRRPGDDDGGERSLAGLDLDSRPAMTGRHAATILNRLNGPADLRGLSEAELATLAAEIRETIVGTVAKTGGHLGSSLGVVELTIALHRLPESPRDRIVWDTG